MPPDPIRADGFTLLELLVVSSILAILMALLTSVTSSVRATTVTLQCANNLRQIGMGLQAFAQSHRGLLPRLSQAPQPSGYSHGYWSHRVYAELGDPSAVTLFQCPGNKRARGSWAQIEGEWIEGKMSYAMPTNDNNARPFLAQNCPVYWHHMREDLQGAKHIADMAPDTILVTDMWDNQDRDSGIWNKWDWQARLLQSWWEVALEPHRQRNNYLYADGSVSRPTFRETIGPDGWYGNTGGDMKGGWTTLAGD